MTATLEERRESWCQPISAGSFGGEPSRYDEKYEALLGELGKLDSVIGEVCNWKKVYEAADVLLRTKSKDMTPLGALCVALLKREGYAGLAAGLAAFQWLLENHSDDMFPKPQRQRGRAGAYTWLTERLIRELETADAGPKDQPALEALSVSFEGIDTVLRAQLGELHPRVGPLTRRFRELLEKAAPPPAPEPEPEPELPPEPSPYEAAPAQEQQPAQEQRPAAAPAARGPALPARIEDDEQARAALDLTVQALRKLAIYHLRREERSSVGYQLAHLAAFVGVLPDGERSAPGTSPRRLRAMQEAVSGRRADEVFRQVLELLEEGGDLDLNAEHCLAQALEEMGYEVALGAVSSHAHCAFRVLGDIIAANADAVAWLQELGGAPPSERGRGDGAGEPAAEEPSGLSVVVAEAERAARRDLEAGCAVIQDALRREGHKAARFKLQLALASLCLKEQAPDLARPILRHLYQELDGSVRSWEPELLVEVIGGLLECYRQLQRGGNPPAGSEQDVEQLMVALTEIDPQAALRERSKNLGR